ncbi:hypothetical protein DPMN_061817 [Dreissena polymorpha]|uniref:Uncharacterized protein n=1 Tax=Dreissena polymorpha TaxID=45954 RepID=A0A9D4C8D7_DREPO|nr:hypothetical protein DPMN_061817 [Dreissena polymorpha]
MWTITSEVGELSACEAWPRCGCGGYATCNLSVQAPKKPPSCAGKGAVSSTK